jgi:hypothetical protein
MGLSENELERIWKEAVMVHFEVLAWRDRKNQKEPQSG